MELRPYQQEDVSKLLTKPAMGVFNEQRTGKTPTSIMTMEQRGVNKLLVICPASLVYKWADEYTQWTNKPAHVISSATKFRKENFNWETGALIINYENLRDNGTRLGLAKDIMKLKPEGVILDEAHRIKERGTANAKAVGICKNIPYKLALTGTPAPNKQWDVWSILHFLYPQMFSSYWRFVENYFLMQKVFVGRSCIDEPVALKPHMAAELQQVLASVSIMRKRKDVMPWLPKQEAPTIIQLPCTPTQTKYIKELQNYFRTEHINTQSVLEQLIRIRQICAAPSILGLKGNSPKIDWLQQYIKDYPDKSILMFSNSTKFIRLVECVVKCDVITGGTSKITRQNIIDDFQMGLNRVLIIQTQAGKEGLTLDNADVTIFLDTYPPAADYLQAKDRMIATTPERVKPQEIIHLMMKDTYDARLYALVNQGVSETAIINDYIDYQIKEVNSNG